jgi:hypothetical protein
MPPAGSRIAIQAAAVCVVGLLSAGCVNDAEAEWSKDPVGTALLPDFAPLPPTDIQMKQVDGSWSVEFSSTVVNVGDGDFHATADKQLDGSWLLTQDIEFDGGGAEHVESDADAVWAGDGHEHWHVKRFVTYRLVALKANGKPTGPARTDHKVGFCIYDFRQSIAGQGPEEAVYERESCGKENSTHLVMGLSPGWADHYDLTLPGQSIDLEGLPDGAYRIYAAADAAGAFREETTDNNETWVDFRLKSDDEFGRVAFLGEVGPSPE